MKKATTVEEQIHLLKSRGVLIANDEEAKEILLNIGYYHLGFYFFPFERSYPQICNRTHNMRENTKFSDAVALYYFDYDIRCLLMRHIERIEVAFRTYVIYALSNKYIRNPMWFVDKGVVSDNFSDTFNEACYQSIRKNQVIVHHHQSHTGDIYAPAWKTLEFMTLGNMLSLYCNLRSIQDKKTIAAKFGIARISIFENYMEVIRCVRNICAHGAVLYDCRLHHLVKKGPAGKTDEKDNYRLGAAIKVIVYMLGAISTNKQRDLIVSLNEAYEMLIKKSPQLEAIIEKSTKISWRLSSISQLQTKK